KGARKPLCYASIKQRAEEHYKTESFPSLEADDVMGILATKPGANCIIVSQDKDMKTIPAPLWDGKEMKHVSIAEADYWHLFQTLVGDNADGYKGCPGIGPVKAAKLLTVTDDNRNLSRWDIVHLAFANAGLDHAAALQQARLARILRWDDWDRQKKEPIL